MGTKHIWAEQFARQIRLHYDYGKGILLCVLVKSVVNVCFVCEFLLFYVLKDHVLYLVTFKNRVPLMC